VTLPLLCPLPLPANSFLLANRAPGSVVLFFSVCMACADYLGGRVLRIVLFGRSRHRLLRRILGHQRACRIKGERVVRARSSVPCWRSSCAARCSAVRPRDSSSCGHVHCEEGQGDGQTACTHGEPATSANQRDGHLVVQASACFVALCRSLRSTQCHTQGGWRERRARGTGSVGGRGARRKEEGGTGN